MKCAQKMLCALGVGVAASCSMSLAAKTTGGDYAIIDRKSGPGANWDYAVVDPAAARFYLAQAGVTVLDLKSNRLVSKFVQGRTTHGVAALGDGRVAVDDSASKTVTIFNGITGEVSATIPTSEFNPVNGMHALDALVLEPSTGLLVAVNGESGLLVLLDVDRATVIGTVSIGGKPEFAVADGSGKLYVNLTKGKTSEIVAVDLPNRKIVAHFPLTGCEEPTGIAYDQADDLLISVCDNGVLKFLHRKDGREAASLEVGGGADAVMFDSKRRRAFVPSAESGTLSIVAVGAGAADIKVVQTLPTQAGTRLGAVDIESGRVYLPAARFRPPVPPSPYPSVVPDSFEILVVAPR